MALHGLEGSSRSPYMTGMAAAAHRSGFRVVALNFRSCGGEANRRPRLYHSGETEDLDFVTRALSARLPGKILLAGFSLGGNVLLKWLGERGEDLPAAVRGAAAVSAPCDLGASAAKIDRPPGFLYRRHLLKSLKKKIRDFDRRFPGRLDAERARRARTFVEFDRWATAPLHGFADEADYYRRSSAKERLPGIRVPTLLLSAADDPIIPASAFPREAVSGSPWLQGALLPAGGHAGFVEGRRPLAASYWAEKCVVGFLSACLGGGREAPGKEGG